MVLTILKSIDLLFCKMSFTLDLLNISFSLDFWEEYHWNNVIAYQRHVLVVCLHVYLYLLPLEPPSHPTPHPAFSSNLWGWLIFPKDFQAIQKKKILVSAAHLLGASRVPGILHTWSPTLRWRRYDPASLEQIEVEDVETQERSQKFPKVTDLVSSRPRIEILDLLIPLPPSVSIHYAKRWGKCTSRT